MALSMHGAPIGSADWDFWVAGENRVKTYNIFKRLGLHGEHKVKVSQSALRMFTAKQL